MLCCRGVPEPFYVNKNFLMFMVVILIITPLAAMKDISEKNSFLSVFFE